MAEKIGTGKKKKKVGDLRGAGGKRRKSDASYNTLVKVISRIVGNQSVHAGDAVCTAYASYAGAPRVVVIPSNLKEMRLVLEACRNAHVPVDTIWSKAVEKDVLLVEGVVIDTRMIARSYNPSAFWNYTHYGEPPVSYRQWGVR